MTTLTANASTLEHPHVAPAESGSNAARWRRPIPFSMPRDQVYYWSNAWQSAESGARADLAAGRFIDFDSNDPSDVLRWLHGPDAED